MIRSCMGAVRDIKRRSRRMLVQIVGALFVCYFLVHSFHGDRGIIAWMHLQKQVTVAETTLSETREVRESLEKQIRLLKINPDTGKLDMDMLDERSRLMTGLVRPNEYIILQK